MSEENQTVDVVTEETTSTVTTTDNNVETFTQDDLNRIGASQHKEGKTKGQREALEALGFESVEQAQARLQQLKDYEDAQKTEQEKLNDKIQAYESDLQVQKDLNTDLQSKYTAVVLGINPESADDAIVLARNMKDEQGNRLEIEVALEKVLEKYPNFKTQVEVEEQKVPKWSAGNSTINNVELSAFENVKQKYKR